MLWDESDSGRVRPDVRCETAGRTATRRAVQRTLASSHALKGRQFDNSE